MFQRVIAVMLFVEDIRRSRDWYARWLGREPLDDLPDFASFQVGPQFLYLHRADAKSALTTGGQVAYWKVADLASAIRSATVLGATLYRGPLEVWENRTRICQMR